LPEILIPGKFKKVLNRKPPQLQARIVKCIKLLGDNPRHPSLHTHPVRGVPGVFEAYADMANRVTFEWSGETILLRNNCNHEILSRSP
jgi:hypothetical protein